MPIARIILSTRLTFILGKRLCSMQFDSGAPLLTIKNWYIWFFTGGMCECPTNLKLIMKFGGSKSSTNEDGNRESLLYVVQPENLGLLADYPEWFQCERGLRPIPICTCVGYNKQAQSKPFAPSSVSLCVLKLKQSKSTLSKVLQHFL